MAMYKSEQQVARCDGHCNIQPSQIIIDYQLTQFHIYIWTS